MVLRARLTKRLNEGVQRKLTLISAPAGFGKTTLVSEWVAVIDWKIAWLSLDEGDNDPARFISYMIAALQTIKAGIGAGLLAALQSSQMLPIESILVTLINEIDAIQDNFIFVLDDYHLIEAKQVDQSIAFLIEHLPRQMHLVIATREDPQLPLSRLRARGQLAELRAADLRFTPAEAAEFLNRVMGLNLSVENIAALEARTEGWIAGLQLAALSMEGREDIVSFIQAFTGSHRFVLDYLVEEVLQRQPESVRSFLLQTAILQRFCASLCNAVTERGDGKDMLDELERSNLFLTTLDDKRQWYRYHHLFAEVLQAHLQEAQHDREFMLHRRASAWYEQNGLRPDAIRHALAAKDYERAAGLIELIWSTMDLNYQSSTWLGWAKALPDRLIRTRPVLSVGGWGGVDGYDEHQRAGAHARDRRVARDWRIKPVRCAGVRSGRVGDRLDELAARIAAGLPADPGSEPGGGSDDVGGSAHLRVFHQRCVGLAGDRDHPQQPGKPDPGPERLPSYRAGSAGG